MPLEEMLQPRTEDQLQLTFTRDGIFNAFLLYFRLLLAISKLVRFQTTFPRRP